MGHMNQQRMNSRSTQPKQEIKIEPELDLDIDVGVKTHHVYDAVINAGQIYTDQTVRVPVVSIRGHVAMTVLYEYDGNGILCEPIKNNKAGELLRTFKIMEQKLIARGLTPKLMTLDNEASKLFKD